MRIGAALIAIMFAGLASAAVAQEFEQDKGVARGVPGEQDKGAARPPSEQEARQRCGSLSPVQRSGCYSQIAKAKKSEQAQPKEAKGSAPAGDAKAYNDAVVAVNAKREAKDFAGAAEIWRTTIAANPQNKVLHRMHAGLAISLRQQAIAAYRADPQPTYPPAGATDAQIRAANAANQALEDRKRAAAVPLLREALSEAVKAATLAEAQTDRGGDEAISVELRENASLLDLLDRPGVLAAPRASVDLEAKWLQAWLAANPTLAEALVAKYGFPVAIALAVKDPAAGIALGDELKVRTKNNADGLVSYAELVSAAKLPASDPRRAQALAAIVTAEPTVAEPALATRLRKAKTALSARP